MTRKMSVVLYIVVLIAVVVSVDLLLFRNIFWERLIVNIGIVTMRFALSPRPPCLPVMLTLPRTARACLD